MALDKRELKIYTKRIVRQISEPDYSNLRSSGGVDNDLKYCKEGLNGFESFYEYEVPTDNELDTALLYKLCKSQDETNKHLKAIKGILIFFTVLTIIGIIAGIILLNQ